MKKSFILAAMGVVWGVSSSWAQQAAPLPTPPPQMESRPLAPEFAKGVIAPVLSVLYFPLKFSVGVAGAVLGGVSGWATGGNQRAAQGIWRPLTGGTYFVTPDVIDGERPFLPLDGGPYAQPPKRTGSIGSMYVQP